MHKINPSMPAYICLIFRYCSFVYAGLYYSHHKGNSPDNRDAADRREIVRIERDALGTTRTLDRDSWQIVAVIR